MMKPEDIPLIPAFPHRSDRGSDGRFLPGNKAMRYNVSTAALMKEAFKEVLNKDEQLAFVRRGLELLHQNEDLRVARDMWELFADRILGKPKESISIEARPANAIDASLLSDHQLSAILAILDNDQPVIELTAIPAESVKLDVVPGQTPVHYGIPSHPDTQANPS